MSNRLDESAMQSELSHSAFFQPAGTATAETPVNGSIGPKPEPTAKAPVNTAHEPSPEAMNGNPFARTPVRRTITRCAFEFYQDQLDRLRRYSLEAKNRGEKGSMSEMVREAIDLYLSGARSRG